MRAAARSDQSAEALLAFSKRSSCSLPRFIAASSASFGSFLPDQIASVS